MARALQFTSSRRRQQVCRHTGPTREYGGAKIRALAGPWTAEKKEDLENPRTVLTYIWVALVARPSTVHMKKLLLRGQLRLKRVGPGAAAFGAFENPRKMR